MLGNDDGQPNNSLDRSANRGAFMRDLHVLAALARRSIRALGRFRGEALTGKSRVMSERPALPSMPPV